MFCTSELKIFFAAMSTQQSVSDFMCLNVGQVTYLFFLVQILFFQMAYHIVLKIKIVRI